MESINSWSQRGKCKGLGSEEYDKIFFPVGTAGVAAGRRFCAGCPVREQCKTYAIAHDYLSGVWGGTSYDERKHVSPVVKQVVDQMYLEAGLMESPLTLGLQGKMTVGLKPPVEPEVQPTTPPWDASTPIADLLLFLDPTLSLS